MTVVNLVGLTVAISIILLLGLLVLHETTFDRSIPNSDRLVLIGSYVKKANGQELKWPILSAGVPVDLKREIPGLESYTRLSGRWNSPIAMTKDDRLVNANGQLYVDSTFFKTTGIELAQGDPNEALVRPHSVVITRSMSRRLFGDEDPMGKECVMRGDRPVTVTGVIEEMPAPSMFSNVDVLASWTTRQIEDSPEWFSQINYYTLFKMGEGTTFENFSASVIAAMDRYREQASFQSGDFLELTTIRLRNIHLFGDYDFFATGSGRFLFVLQFIIIGVILLLIASFNYVNLTTAQSIRRGLFVGVAKTLGASRMVLARQFVLEAVVLTVASMIAGVLLAWLLLPMFSNLVEVQVADVLHQYPHIPWLILPCGIVFSILLGLFPALSLSRVRPMFALKGQSGSGCSRAKLRQALVVVQFALATGLIVSSLVVLRQMHFIRTADIGFDRENVMTVRLGNWDLMTSYKTLYDEMRQKPYVISSSTADQLPIHYGNVSSYYLEGASPDEGVIMSQRCVDHEYLKTLGIHLLQGRNFDPDRSLDSLNAVLINQATAKAFGIENDPVGKTFKSIYYYKTEQRGVAEIIGVVDDYNYQSMREKVQPLFLRLYGGFPPWLIFRLQAGTEPQAIADLEALWKEFAPGVAPDYSFLDDRFNNLYQTEERLGQLFRLFTLISIMVAGMGLFAMSAFVAERRTKEIGVRKVLGAQIPQVVNLLVKDFLKLVVVANLIAVPISWWLMRQWLDGFAFRTNLSWWLFAATFGLSVVIALAAVSVHAVRASLTNPVNVLRDE